MSDSSKIKEESSHYIFRMFQLMNIDPGFSYQYATNGFYFQISTYNTSILIYWLLYYFGSIYFTYTYLFSQLDTRSHKIYKFINYFAHRIESDSKKSRLASQGTAELLPTCQLLVYHNNNYTFIKSKRLVLISDQALYYGVKLKRI